MNRQYRLFFSWQSEDKKSRKTLDVALQNVVDTLDDRGIRLEIDHSTLGESGMPSIDQTILRKIDACDIFLADVTPVTTYQKSSGNGMQVSKDVPNPNVLLELGYAMSALGVGYVIIVAHQVILILHLSRRRWPLCPSSSVRKPLLVCTTLCPCQGNSPQ